MKWADDEAQADQPLAEALRLQRAAATQGFDWPELAPLWVKLHEEIDELKEAVSSGDRAEMQAELGDLFFMLVNLSRFLEISSPAALHMTNRKFIHRMRHIETCLQAQGKSWDEMDLDGLEALWQQAKRPESNRPG